MKSLNREIMPVNFDYCCRLCRHRWQERFRYRR